MTLAGTLVDWLDRATARLSAGPHPERARRDAEALLLHLLHRDRAFLIAHSHETLSAEGAVRYHALIDRRRAGEPIQYIAGETEFYGLPFHVTRDVLIPRPETEHVVEKVLELAAQFSAPRIVDVGTGSGAIAVALARNLQNARITAVDLSPPALALARKNAVHNGVESRIRFLHGDLLTPVAGEQFEIVVSNPPYVPDSDHALLAPEVREFEPALALFAGPDGLGVYRRLIPAAHGALARAGFVVLEIGFTQEAEVRALLEQAGFGQVAFTADLQGIPRVALARKS